MREIATGHHKDGRVKKWANKTARLTTEQYSQHENLRTRKPLYG
jgi:hypothetical protein